MDVKISFILKNACGEDDINEESIVFNDKIKKVLGEKLLRNITKLEIEKIKTGMNYYRVWNGKKWINKKLPEE